MNINVIEFFRRLSSDPVLRQRVQDAEDMYPGSLEMRETVVEFALLPIAEELGIPFTVDDLRAYETQLKLELGRDNTPANQDMTWDSEVKFYLIDHGWNSDEASFCKH